MGCVFWVMNLLSAEARTACAGRVYNKDSGLKWHQVIFVVLQFRSFSFSPSDEGVIRSYCAVRIGKFVVLGLISLKDKCAPEVRFYSSDYI